MTTFTDLEENDGAFADDLVNDEGGHDYKEYRAKGQDEVELSAENVLVCMLDEEIGDLSQT